MKRFSVPRLVVFILGSFILSGSVAQAAETNLIVQPWRIVQENLPSDALTSFETEKDNSAEVIAQAHGANVRIQHLPGIDRYMLHLDGRPSPCLSSDGSPRRSELLLRADGDEVSPATQADTTAADNPKFTLDKMDRLMVSGVVSVTSGLVAKPKGCKMTQGGAIIVVAIRNTTARQIINYKLTLSKLCGERRDGANLTSCAEESKTQQFHTTKSALAVDDFMPLVNQPWLVNNETRNLDIDLLPRLKEAIHHAPAMDKDLSHWSVSAVSVGQQIWGDARLTSSWMDVQLRAITP